MKMKLAELISVATREKTDAGGGLWREPGGVYSVFILEDARF